MLATHLYKLSHHRPVRYQLERSLLLPVANFLHLAARGLDLPHLHQQAGEQLHPASQSMFADLLGHGDPESLGVLGDLLQDTSPHDPGTMPQPHPHGMPAGGGQLALAQLVNRIHHLHQTVYGQGLPVEHLRQQFGYDPSQLHPNLRTTQGATQTPLGQHWFQSRGFLAPHYGLEVLLQQAGHTGAVQRLREIRRRAYGGPPEAYAQLYDFLRDLHQNAGLGPQLQQRAGQERGRMADAINSLVLPLLHGAQIQGP